MCEDNRLSVTSILEAGSCGSCDKNSKKESKYHISSNKRPPSNKRTPKIWSQEIPYIGPLKCSIWYQHHKKILFMKDTGHIFKEHYIFVKIFGQFWAFFLEFLNKRTGTYSRKYDIWKVIGTHNRITGYHKKCDKTFLIMGHYV